MSKGNIMTKAKISMFLGIAGISLALAGCGPKPAAPPASPATGGAAVTAASGKPFVVSYNQWIGFVGLFAALDKGYFQAAGLNVQPKQFPGPVDSMPLLMTGKIDLALTTADTVILLNQRAGAAASQCVYIIDTSDGADGLIALKDVPNMQALRGKDVAATPGQCNELLLLKALQKAGMTEKDVRVTTMDADTAGAAIIAGKVPAAVTWEPWLTKAAAGGAHVLFSSHDAPNTILDVVAASPQTMTGRTSDLKAFVAAYAKGAEYAKAHPDEAEQMAAKHLGTSAADAKTMLAKVKLYGAGDERALIGDATKPGPVFASAKEIGQFYVAQKQLKTQPDTSKVFTTEYLPQ